MKKFSRTIAFLLMLALLVNLIPMQSLAASDIESMNSSATPTLGVSSEPLTMLGDGVDVDWQSNDRDSASVESSAKPDESTPVITMPSFTPKQIATLDDSKTAEPKKPGMTKAFGIEPMAFSTDGDWEYDGGTIIKYHGTASDLTIPGSLGGTTITAIGDYAFQDTVVVNVTFPNSIRTIGYAAFDNCTGLRSIELNTGLTTIRGRAFYNCRAMTTITIPNSVTTLNDDYGDGTFENCISLTTVTLGTGLRDIPNNTFQSCHSLTTVNMGNQIRTIGESVFYDCWSLDAINLQNAPLTSIGNYAFENCVSLSEIALPTNMRMLGYNVFKNCIVLENVNLNEGLTTINGGAFYNCISLVSITIPNSVTTLDSDYWDGTFRECISLTSVTIGSGLREIPRYAFYGCTSLTTVRMGSKVNTIGEYAFEGCKSMDTISFQGSPLTTIGDGAFKGCSSINAITLPNTMRVIGYEAFRECTVLETITLNAGLTTINSGAFYNCASLKSINIPNSVTTLGGDYWSSVFNDCINLTTVTIGTGLREIPASAFYGCYSLSTLNMGANVNTIGEYAFYGCKSLTSVVLGKVTNLGYNAFQDCTGLVNVTLGNSLNTIESSAFNNCISLRSVTFRTSLRTIDDGAFYSCMSFEVTDTLISSLKGKGVTIADNAFYGCKGADKLSAQTFKASINLKAEPSPVPENECVEASETNIPQQTEIIEPRTANNFEAFSEGSSGGFEYWYDEWDDHPTVTITGYTGSAANVTLPNIIDTYPVTAIGDYAFQGTSIENITIPSNIKTIGYYAFENCRGLGSVSIPDNITKIDYAAFQNCISLETVTIGNGLREIPSNAFYGCSSLTAVNMGSRVNLINNNAFNGCRSLETIDLQNSSLTEIGSAAFEDCRAINIITLPNSTKIIGDYAFKNCRGLDNLSLNEGLTIISYEAFNGCISLSEIVFPNSVKAISSNTFNGCTSLEKVTIGTGLREIPDSAFYGCSSLTTVVMRGNVKFIGSKAFYGCRSLETIDLKNSQITSIGDAAFEDCKGINKIELPSSMKVMGNYVFKGCTGLETLSLNNGLTTIGYEAFKGCISLPGATLPNSVMTMDSNAFSGCTSLETVTIGKGLREIRESSFYECTSLSTVTIGGKILRIGQYSFYGCRSLESIDLSGTSTVGYCAFQNCSGLTKATLGNDLNTIEDSAFRGCVSLRSITFGTSLKMIGSSAFYGCTNLGSVDLSRAPVIEIRDSAFNGCRGVSNVIIGRTVQTIRSSAFYNNTSLKNLSLGSSVIIIGSSAFAGNTGLETVEFPDSLQKIESSAFSGCRALLNATIPANVWIFDWGIFSNADDNFTVIGVPGSPAEQFATDNGYIFAPLGDHVTLDVDETTNVATIKVAGSSPMGKSVKIYDGSTLIGTFTTGKNRRYSGSVTLTGQGTRTVRAVIDADGGGTVTASRTVRYDLLAPRLTEFIMHHDGQKINLITTDGIRQTLIFRGGSPFTFEIKMENADQIEELYVCSERNGVNKYIRAFYDSSKGLWLATGFFDPNDTNYVPGRLSVQITGTYELIKIPEFDFKEKIDYNNVEFTEEWKNATHDVLINKSNESVIKTTLADEDQTTFITSYKTEQVEDISEQELMASGFMTLTDINGETVYAKLISTDELSVSFEFYRENQPHPLSRDGWEVAGWTKTGIDIGIESGYYLKKVTAPKWLPWTSFGVSTVMDAAEGISYTSSCNNPDVGKSELLLFGAKTAIGLGGLALASLFTGGAALVAAVAIGVGSQIANNYITNAIREGTPCNKEAGASSGSYRVAVDPSGYVYEAVPSNRLPGVKTTVYYKEKQTDTTSAIWDASEYDQANPLYTDHEGRYAWDVPEGWWQVKYEMTGYETSYSDWLPVPPPQTDVNTGMVSKTAPVVERVNGYTSGIEIVFSKYIDIGDMINAENIITVTQGGNTINGELEFSDREWNPVTSRFYAKIIRFIPDDDLSGNVQLNISTDIRSYAEVKMTAAYSQSIPIMPEPKKISAQDVSIEYSKTGNINVSLEPAEAVAGKKLMAVSSDPFIATVTNEVTINADGTAVVPVSAVLPGSAYVTLSLEGTTLQTQLTVNSTMTVVPKLNRPTASISSGTKVQSGTSVEFFSNTLGATIYYTTDGSCPRTSSTRTVYSKPIKITDDVSFLVVVFMEGYEESDVMTFSYTVDVITNTVPTAPQNFTATPGNGQVALSWTAPSNNGGSAITGYQVSSNNGSTWVTASSITSHTFTGLTNGTSYTFKVRAVNSVGNGAEASATATPQDSATVPTVPQNFTATPGNGQVALSWTAPSNNGGSAITGYQVSSNNGSTWVTVSSNTSHTFTGLTNGTSYTFKVRAINSVGNGTEASVTATPQTAGNQDRPLISISLSKTFSTLAVGQTETLIISYNPTDTTDSKNATWSTSNANVATVSNGVVTAKSAGTTMITAKVGNKEASCTITVTGTTGKLSQNAPATPKMKSKTTTSITLNTIPNAEYRRDNGTWQSSATFKGLKANTSYKFYARLKATVTHNESLASAALTVKTKEQLKAPTKLKLTSKKATWNNVKNNNGYILRAMDGKKVAFTVQIKKNKASHTFTKAQLKKIIKGKKYTFTLVVKGKGNFVNSKVAKSKAVTMKK